LEEFEENDDCTNQKDVNGQDRMKRKNRMITKMTTISLRFFADHWAGQVQLKHWTTMRIIAVLQFLEYDDE
jgi:hypothetical protein